MKNCIRCSQPVSDNADYCPACGADQRLFTKGPVRYDDTFLKVLCILTITGASISLLSAARATGSLTELANGYRIIQLIAILAAIGKMTGAILMLQKRRNGLYIYTVAASVSILLTTAVAFWLDMLPKDEDVPEWIMQMSVAIGITIAMGFIIMYWLKVNRRLLS